MCVRGPREPPPSAAAMRGLCASNPYPKLGPMKSKVVAEAHLLCEESGSLHTLD